ncbi:transposable element Tcb2 transposase [Trichonephila clavipes]|nr:transposable element Tcb2 transposase [Trichonephila clavipes]
MHVPIELTSSMTTWRVQGFARMAWPAYSPDLNPIESLWDALGHAVFSRFPPPATLIELETVLQEECRLLNSAVVDHLMKAWSEGINFAYR